MGMVFPSLGQSRCSYNLVLFLLLWLVLRHISSQMEVILLAALSTSVLTWSTMPMVPHLTLELRLLLDVLTFAVPLLSAHLSIMTGMILHGITPVAGSTPHGV